MNDNNQAIPAAVSNIGRWSGEAEMCALVVDDDESIREMVGSALSLVGFKVKKAANGMQAYESLLKNPVDLVITDLQMPVMDGLDLTQRINHHSPRTPVVIITGGGLLNGKENGGELSVFAVLRKPFRLDKIQHIALQAVNGRQDRYDKRICEATY